MESRAFPLIKHTTAESQCASRFCRREAKQLEIETAAKYSVLSYSCRYFLLRTVLDEVILTCSVQKQLHSSFDHSRSNARTTEYFEPSEILRHSVGFFVWLTCIPFRVRAVTKQGSTTANLGRHFSKNEFPFLLFPARSMFHSVCIIAPNSPHCKFIVESLRSLRNVKSVHFTSFCSGRRRNQPDSITHVQCHCEFY